MIELRWFMPYAKPPMMSAAILQYRSLRPTWLASGAWGEPSQWSDWQDVPHVNERAPKDAQ